MKQVILNEMVKYYFNLGKLTKKDFAWAKTVLGNKSSSGVYKEEVVLSKFGLDSDEHLHHYVGGIPKENKRLWMLCFNSGPAVEVKSETFRPANGKSKSATKLSGETAWGGKNDVKYEELVVDNPLTIVTGSTDSGKAAYVVAFEFNDSAMKQKIDSYLQRRKDSIKKTKKLKSMTIKCSWKDFEHAESLKVLYYNPKYSDMISGPFNKLILNKYYGSKIIDESD